MFIVNISLCFLYYVVASPMFVGSSCRIPFFSPPLVSSPGVAQPLSSTFQPEIYFGSGSPRLIPLECALPRIAAANAVESALVNQRTLYPVKSALTKKGRRPSASRIISRHPSRALPQTPWNLHLRNQRPYLQQNVHLRKKEEGGYGSCGLFRFFPKPSARPPPGRLFPFLPFFRLYNSPPTTHRHSFLPPPPHLSHS